MAVRSEVIVRVQWADPERSGLRTLRFQARSLENACELIARSVGPVIEDDGAAPTDDGASEQRPQPRAFQPRPRRAKAGRNGAAAPSADEDAPATGNGHTPAPFVEGTVEWVGEVPAGHLLPAMTLVRARAGQRKVVLRLAGAHEFDVGTRVYLSGLNGAGTLFDAELVSGAGKPPFFFEVQAWRV